MKTLLSDTPGAGFARAAPTGEAPLRRKGGPNAACPRPVRLGHITTLSSPFNQRPAAVARGVSLELLRNVAHALAFGACRAANRRFAGGGGERIRTDDLLLAKQALSQLSYTPGQRCLSGGPGRI